MKRVDGDNVYGPRFPVAMIVPAGNKVSRRFGSLSPMLCSHVMSWSRRSFSSVDMWGCPLRFLHFVWIGLQVVKFVDVLRIPHVFVSFVANGAHFKAVTVVAVVGAIVRFVASWVGGFGCRRVGEGCALLAVGRRDGSARMREKRVSPMSSNET